MPEKIKIIIETFKKILQKLDKQEENKEPSENSKGINFIGDFDTSDLEIKEFSQMVINVNHQIEDKKNKDEGENGDKKNKIESGDKLSKKECEEIIMNHADLSEIERYLDLDISLICKIMFDMLNNDAEEKVCSKSWWNPDEKQKTKIKNILFLLDGKNFSVQAAFWNLLKNRYFIPATLIFCIYPQVIYEKDSSNETVLDFFKNGTKTLESKIYLNQINLFLSICFEFLIADTIIRLKKMAKPISANFFEKILSEDPEDGEKENLFMGFLEKLIQKKDKNTEEDREKKTISLLFEQYSFFIKNISNAFTINYDPNFDFGTIFSTFYSVSLFQRYFFSHEPILDEEKLKNLQNGYDELLKNVLPFLTPMLEERKELANELQSRYFLLLVTRVSFLLQKFWNLPPEKTKDNLTVAKEIKDNLVELYALNNTNSFQKMLVLVLRTSFESANIAFKWATIVIEGGNKKNVGDKKSLIKSTIIGNRPHQNAWNRIFENLDIFFSNKAMQKIFEVKNILLTGPVFFKGNRDGILLSIFGLMHLNLTSQISGTFRSRLESINFCFDMFTKEELEEHILPFLKNSLFYLDKIKFFSTALCILHIVQEERMASLFNNKSTQKSTQKSAQRNIIFQNLRKDLSLLNEAEDFIEKIIIKLNAKKELKESLILIENLRKGSKNAIAIDQLVKTFEEEYEHSLNSTQQKDFDGNAENELIKEIEKISSFMENGENKKIKNKIDPEETKKENFEPQKIDSDKITIKKIEETKPVDSIEKNIVQEQIFEKKGENDQNKKDKKDKKDKKFNILKKMYTEKNEKNNTDERKKENEFLSLDFFKKPAPWKVTELTYSNSLARFLFIYPSSGEMNKIGNLDKNQSEAYQNLINVIEETGFYKGKTKGTVKTGILFTGKKLFKTKKYKQDEELPFMILGDIAKENGLDAEKIETFLKQRCPGIDKIIERAEKEKIPIYLTPGMITHAKTKNKNDTIKTKTPNMKTLPKSRIDYLVLYNKYNSQNFPAGLSRS